MAAVAARLSSNGIMTLKENQLCNKQREDSFLVKVGKGVLSCSQYLAYRDLRGAFPAHFALKFIANTWRTESDASFVIGTCASTVVAELGILGV